MARKRMKGWELTGPLASVIASRFCSAHTKSEAREIFKRRLYPHDKGRTLRLPVQWKVVFVQGV